MKRRLISLTLFLAFMAVITVLARQYFTWAELIAHETSLREGITHRPIQSILIGFGVYTVVCLIPGTTGKSLVFGWLYGIWQGGVIVNFGLTVAAVLTFLASRYLLRDVVQEKFGHHLQTIDNAVQRDGASYVFMLRVLHCPYSFTNYLCGATSMRVSSFWWATQLGMLPGNIVFVYAGSRVPSLSQFADHGAASVFSWQLLGALLLLSILPILVRYTAVRWRAARLSRQT